MNSGPDDTFPNQQVDAGLEIAFGAAEISDASVLRILRERIGSSAGVYLDAPEPDGAPVKVTEAGRALHDPTGRYQVVGEIGRGGVGIVYKGRDVDLGRDVAMKVLRDEHAGNPDVLERFVEEAQIGGQLQHPGIVPVYSLGLQHGERPYFAMKLVKGETLAALLARRGDVGADRRRLIGVFEQVCQTLAYAHARRVVHRDLKPANIMVGAFGEVQVVDWGFAKVLPKGGIADEAEAGRGAGQRSVIATVRSNAEVGSHSAAGSVMGTPPYMSPEQANGEVDRMDQRSDVFGLGAILCEILTGEPPYREVDGKVLLQAAQGAVQGARARLAACGADRSMIELAVRCLSPDQKARPDSAAVVAEHVAAWLVSVEERARRAELRAARARYKARTTAILATAVVLLLAVGGGAWSWIRSENQARRDAAAGRLTTATAAASGLLGEARSASADAGRWDRAMAAVEQVAVSAADPMIDAEKRRAVGEFVAAAERDRDHALAATRRQQRDRAMQERLVALRIPTDDDVRASSWAAREAARLDREYAAAFADYVAGDILAAPPAATVATLKRSAIPGELAAALDHWAMVRDGVDAEPERTATLRRIARAIDDANDPWGARLRALLPVARSERAAIERLADEADLTALPAISTLLLAEALWQADARDRAVAVCRRGRELHPADFGLCFRLAVLLELVAEPDWEGVVETQSVARALRPDMAEVLHRKGMALTRLGRYADAVRIFGDLLELQPDHEHWLRHRGFAAYKLGDRALELACYRRANELRPDRIDTLASLALALEADGQFEAAAAAAREALALPSEEHAEPPAAPAAEDLFRADANGVVARAMATAGRFEDAVRHAAAAAALARNPDSRVWLARIHLAAGDFDGASAALAGAIALDAGCIDAWEGRGEVEHMRHDYEAAIDCFRRVIELDPQRVSGHCGLGNALGASGRVDDAIAAFRSALQLDPAQPILLCNVGTALLNGGRSPQQARAAFEQALVIDDACAPAIAGLGMVEAQEGDHAAAIAAFERAIAIDPRCENAHYNLGVSLALTERHEAAASCYRRTLELNPFHLHAMVFLGDALARLDRFDDAVASYRRALALAPEWHEARNNLGIMLGNAGRHDESMACFRAILARDPEHVLALFNLADGLSTRGDYVGALEALRRAASGAGARPEGNDWIARVDEAIATIEAARDRLPAILSGEAAAADPGEWAAAVQRAVTAGDHRAVVTLTERTLTTAAQLVEASHAGLYPSACSAARAAADPAAPAADGARWLSLARTWLLHDVERWEVWCDTPQRADEGRRRLELAQTDPAFAGVRGEAIATLPPAERAAWQALWQRVAAAAAKHD
ncbi:MAG: tetratricopeptide repeat protein [Planctomycetes bacterium]|nr:tetratricopeptide repeat protein [Planctomycetota bacterium]